MKYLLSRIIPMHFTSTYGVEYGKVKYQEDASWWQWRDHIFQHRTVPSVASV